MGSLIERKKAIMMMQKSLLPPGYRQIEYLESSGTQYILTPFTYVYGYRIRMTITNPYPFWSSSYGYLGWWNSASQNNLQSFSSSSLGRTVLLITRGINNNTTKIIDRALDDEIIVDGLNITIGNYQYTANVIPPDIGVKFALFGYNRTTGVVNCSGSSRIYYAKFFDSNQNMIGNYIPCVRKADSKPGMYDTVANAFYMNDGADEFIIPS